MDNAAIEKELKDQRELLEKVFASAEKTRKYILWSVWGTIILFVVPLILMAVAIPWFLNSYTGYLTGAGLGL